MRENMGKLVLLDIKTHHKSMTFKTQWYQPKIDGTEHITHKQLMQLKCPKFHQSMRSYFPLVPKSFIFRKESLLSNSPPYTYLGIIQRMFACSINRSLTSLQPTLHSCAPHLLPFRDHLISPLLVCDEFLLNHGP